jgi:hypothetical protein
MLNPVLEPLESRQLLSFADGNGPVVNAITYTSGSSELVITFDGPLSAGPAQDVANYQINRAPANPELITRNRASVKIIAANYTDTGISQVTLTLQKNSLKPGVFYRVFINGTPASMSVNAASKPLTDINGVLFDGDNDDTPGGDFYGLFALGPKVAFTDSAGSRVALAVKGGGAINIWRELDGDIDQLSVVGPDAGISTLTGSARGGPSTTVYVGSVTIPVPAPLTLNGATDLLPQSFVTLATGLATPAPAPTAKSPLPMVGTNQNLPYTESITPIGAPAAMALPGLEAAVSATTAPTKADPKGLWLFFGGRTNGLHNFTASGVSNFPPDFQNEDIVVVNPANWQIWSVPWSQTDVPIATYNSLSSAAQGFYQKGNTLYAVGGYSVPDTINLTGNTTEGSTIVEVSTIAGLAIGQHVTGAAIPYINAVTQAAIDVTITAIGTGTITLSQPAIATATSTILTASSDKFTTYDTLTSINISGMIHAVQTGGDVARESAIRQMSDPRLAVTGGVLTGLGGRTYLVFGQNFQGGYGAVDFTQIYSDEIKRFRIVTTRKSLAIMCYQALRDPVNFRRRDGNLSTVISRAGTPGLTYYGGVFSPGAAGTAYTSPIIIGGNGKVRVDASYQQYFDQYTTAQVALYDARSRAMITLFMGGISDYDYDYPGGPLTNLTTGGNSPGWVDDVSSLVQSQNGHDQEYIMPPLPGDYGAYSEVLANPSVPTYNNGVIKLAKLKRPTVVGYVYGGIYSTVAQTTEASQTGASNQVFAVTITPTR